MAITKGIYICADEPTEPSADMFLEPGSFTSNNEQCFEIQYVKDTRKLFYNTFGDDSYEVYNYATKTWTDIAWKTIDVTSTNTGNDWFFANYTKQKLSVDLTTLPGWANLSAGNHTIKIKAKGTGYKESELSAGVTVSKAASTVTLEAGVYKFIESPQFYTVESDESISTDLSGNMNTLVSDNTYGNMTIFNSIVITFSPVSSRNVIEISGLDEVVRGYKTEWEYNDVDGVTYTAADTTKLRTIIIETDQQVSPEFYKWAITQGNLVKYEQAYLLNTTLSMPSTAAYYGLEGGYKIGDSIYDSICIGYNNGKELRIAWRDDSGDLMWDTLYNSSGWLKQSNRGLTLLKEPAPAFLTWLQANSTQPV